MSAPVDRRDADIAQLRAVATNAAALIGAVYLWLDRVKAAGGATSIAGIAACHAMLNSLEHERPRIDKLIVAPLRATLTDAVE